MARVSSQAVPALVNYQGRLGNPDGTALATGDYTLTFCVYDSPTNSGGLVWGPQVFDGVAGQGHGGKIPVVQGYFNVMLGPVDTNGASLDTAFNATNRFVEIRVGTNNSVLPRQQILSAPYALNAAKLASYDWSALLGTNNPMSGVIPFNKLATREVGTNVGVGGIARSLPLAIGDFSATPPTIDFEYLLTNLTVTLQTRGNPVVLMPIVFDTSAVTAFQAGRSSAPTGLHVHYYRNGQKIVDIDHKDSGTTLQSSPTPFRHFDFPPAGTNKYEVRVSASAGGTISISVQNVQLVAFEL